MTDQENNNSISSNPFAALFGSVADAKHFAAVQKQQQQQLRQLRGTGRGGWPRRGGEAAAPARSAEELRSAGDETSVSQDDSDNSVSESLDDCDYSVAEISRSFRSQRELCEQLNINHMIQRIFLITLDNSERLSPRCCAGGRGRCRLGKTPRCRAELDPGPRLAAGGAPPGEGTCLGAAACSRQAWAGPCPQLPLPAGAFPLGLVKRVTLRFSQATPA